METDARIDLDAQGSTPVLPEALAAMIPWFSGNYGSASALHSMGLTARDALDLARGQCAGFIHANSPQEIIFTSCGTEAVNLAIQGTALASRRRGKHLVVSATEHPAVLKSVAFLESLGFTSTKVPVDGSGRVNVEAFRAALTPETILIALQCVNYETGAIQPLAEVAALANEKGIPLFLDAVAAAGWMPLDVAGLGISFMAVSAHRFYGPKGAGFLYRRRGTRLDPVLHGATQEEGKRAGTENIPALVGMGVACAVASVQLEHRAAQARTLQNRMWEALRTRIPLIHRVGPLLDAQRAPHLLSVCIEYLEGEGVVLASDLRGVAISSGQSCISRGTKVSPVLTAMGIEPRMAMGAILISFGKDTSPGEVDRAAEIIAIEVARQREMSPSHDEFMARAGTSGAKS